MATLSWSKRIPFYKDWTHIAPCRFGLSPLYQREEEKWRSDSGLRTNVNRLDKPVALFRRSLLWQCWIIMLATTWLSVVYDVHGNADEWVVSNMSLQLVSADWPTNAIWRNERWSTHGQYVCFQINLFGNEIAWDEYHGSGDINLSSDPLALWHFIEW